MKLKTTLALSALALGASLLAAPSVHAQTQISCASVDGTTSTNWTDGDTVKRCTNTSSTKAAKMQSTLKAVDALQVSSPNGPVDSDFSIRLRSRGLTFYLFHEGDDYLSGALGGPSYIDPLGLVRNQVGDSIINGSEKYSVIFEKKYLRNQQNPLIKHTTAHELGHHADAIYSGSLGTNSSGIIQGPVTPGDKLKLTISHPQLANPVEIKYTVKADDTEDSIAKKLANRINADSDLNTIGIKAVAPGLGGLRIGSLSGTNPGITFDAGGGTEQLQFAPETATTLVTTSALFRAALAADIRGMNKSNPCSIMISDPDKPEEPPVQQDGLFTNALDSQGNWICGAPGAAGTTPIYGGNNIHIAAKAWPNLFPRDANGKIAPELLEDQPEELFAEEVSVVVGFRDTLSDDGSEIDGSDHFISGGSPLSSFTCTYFVAMSLVENGSYPSYLGSYSYVEHQGTTNKATLHKCDGSSEDITIPIGS